VILAIKRSSSTIALSLICVYRSRLLPLQPHRRRPRNATRQQPLRPLPALPPPRAHPLPLRNPQLAKQSHRPLQHRPPLQPNPLRRPGLRQRPLRPPNSLRALENRQHLDVQLDRTALRAQDPRSLGSPRRDSVDGYSAARQYGYAGPSGRYGAFQQDWMRCEPGCRYDCLGGP
jgi:hypothetical protein